MPISIWKAPPRRGGISPLDQQRTSSSVRLAGRSRFWILRAGLHRGLNARNLVRRGRGTRKKITLKILPNEHPEERSTDFWGKMRERVARIPRFSVKESERHHPLKRRQPMRFELIVMIVHSSTATAMPPWFPETNAIARCRWVMVTVR